MRMKISWMSSWIYLRTCIAGKKPSNQRQRCAEATWFLELSIFKIFLVKAGDSTACELIKRQGKIKVESFKS